MLLINNHIYHSANSEISLQYIYCVGTAVPEGQQL